MDRKMFKQIMEFRMVHKDKTKILSHEEQLDILRQSIDVCNQEHPGPFSGYYNIIVALEEFGELTQEIGKALREKPNEIGILEELADVSLGLDYIKEVFNISDEQLCHARSIKMQRLKSNLKSKNKKY